MTKPKLGAPFKGDKPRVKIAPTIDSFTKKCLDTMCKESGYSQGEALDLILTFPGVEGILKLEHPKYT